MMYHRPALLSESVEALAINKDGIFVDVTFGGGGHSKLILDSLGENGKLYAFDQDPDAKRNAIDDKRFTLIQQNFSYLKNYLKMYRAIPIDGLLADLGVSFHQFDQPERGFSFRFNGPLDMRMDKSRDLTAAKIINEYSEEDLTALFKNYGELNHAKKIAAVLVEKRTEAPIVEINQLLNCLKTFVPERHAHKFYAQVFQALRIEVNAELKVIEDLLEQSLEVIKKGGRFAVITYHSLEDRLVKNFFKTGNVQGKLEKDFYGNVLRPFEPVNRKPIIPSEKEIGDNNRARSAKLRVAERRA